MPYNKYPAAYNPSTNMTRVLPKASLAVGGVGAIIGGTAAAAKNIRRVKNEEINREEAVRDTVKEAAGAGLATAAATAVAGAVGGAGWLSLLGFMAVATGAKYVWDSAVNSQKAAAPVPAPAAEKSAAAETKNKK